MKTCSADITCTSVQGGKVPSKSSGSDDEKTMHPQCITEPSVDAALKRAKSPSGAIEEGDAGLLADELLRLREELNVERGVRSALEQACSQDMAKLARVEALADALDRSGNLTVVASIRKALSDPQPSAAPTPPKKGEPYNGW